MKRVAGFQYENRRLLAKWRDSFASAPIGADRGSPPSSWRRQRSSALHLIVRVSHAKDKSRESKCSFGFYGPSGETRLHFLPGGKKIDVLPPSSRRQATVHRTVAFDRSSLAFKRKMQVWHKAIPAFLVRVARLELAESWS